MDPPQGPPTAGGAPPSAAVVDVPVGGPPNADDVSAMISATIPSKRKRIPKQFFEAPAAAAAPPAAAPATKKGGRMKTKAAGPRGAPQSKVKTKAVSRIGLAPPPSSKATAPHPSVPSDATPAPPPPTMDVDKLFDVESTTSYMDMLNESTVDLDAGIDAFDGEGNVEEIDDEEEDEGDEEVVERKKRRKSWSLMIGAVAAGSAWPEVYVLGAAMSTLDKMVVTMSQERQVRSCSWQPSLVHALMLMAMWFSMENLEYGRSPTKKRQREKSSTKKLEQLWEGETLRESIKRYEHFLALKLGLTEGMKVGCYREIHRVLRPGQRLAFYEWCMTDQFDPGNPRHADAKAEIELGNGLTDIRTTAQCVQAVKDAGFEVRSYQSHRLLQVICAKDVAEDSPVPWYQPLDPDAAGSWSWMASTSGFRLSRVGRLLTRAMVKAMERLGVAPEGSVRVSGLMETAGEGLVKGGRAGIFTPMFFVLARKKPVAN
ncbi:hypothetical protein ACQ4PT_056876 [Festuca glaucescens]